MPSAEGVDHSIEIHDHISVTESAFIMKSNEADETVGLVVSRGGPDPRVAASDLNDDGRVVSRIEGRASNKLNSELRTAQLLVDKLNTLGGRWGQAAAPDPGTPEEGVDAVATDSERRTLKIQVTTPETRAWAALSKAGAPWSSDEVVEEAVLAVYDAIRRKHLKAHPDIILALDATDSPRFSLTSVTQTFRSKHAAWARGNFAQVWMVGPVVDAVERLDE